MRMRIGHRRDERAGAAVGVRIARTALDGYDRSRWIDFNRNIVGPAMRKQRRAREQAVRLASAQRAPSIKSIAAPNATASDDNGFTRSTDGAASLVSINSV